MITKKRKGIALLVALMMLFSVTTAYGAVTIPGDSVLIGSKGFHTDYLMDPANFTEINQAVTDAGDAPIFFNLAGMTTGWEDVFTRDQATQEQLDALLPITYKDGEGNETTIGGQLQAVTVSPINDISVDFGTAVDAITFPATVTLNLSDGTTAEVAATFACETYDANVAGEYVFTATYELPEGVTGEKPAATVKVIVAEKALLAVESVSAINETTVQLTGVPATITETDLTGKQVTLAGDETLTATYVEGSLTAEGKANFALDDGKKLTDAVSYTVSSDWATFTTATFTAKTVAAYVKSIVAVTTAVPTIEYVPAAEPKPESGTTDIQFKALNQYGEDIAINATTMVGTTAEVELSGIPLSSTEVTYTVGSNIVTLKKTLAENDQLKVTIKKGTTVLGSFEYTVTEAATRVATTLELTGDKTSMAAQQKVTYTVVVKDQFGTTITSPGAIRWVLKKDGAIQTGYPIDEGLTKELTINDPGTYTVQAALVSKLSLNQTLSLTVGAAELTSFTSSPSWTPGYNNEDIKSTKIAANTGALLTPAMLKFNIVASTTGTTAADITVSAGLKGGTGADKDDIILTAKTTKTGSYRITPYVGTSFDAEDAVKASSATLTTTVRPAVTSIDEIQIPTLTVGQATAKISVVAKNIHGEIVAVNPDNLTIGLFTEAGDSAAANFKAVEKFAARSDVQESANFTLQANEAGTYKVTVAVTGSSATSRDITVTAEKRTLASVSLGADITSGVIAGKINNVDADKVYRQLTVLDDKGANYIPDLVNDANKLNATAKLGDEAVADFVALKYYKANTDGTYDYTVAKADAEGVALEINANGLEYTEDKTLVVTVTNNAEGASEIRDTLNVKVQAVRKLATINVEQSNVTLALGGVSKLTVVPQDQYGTFFENDNMSVVSSDATVVAQKDGFEESKDAKGKLIGYTFQLEGKKTGTATVDVKDNTEDSTIKDTVGVTVSSAADVVKSIKVVYSIEAKQDANGNYKYVLKHDSQSYNFEVIAYDANGAEIAISASELIWVSSDPVAKVKNGTVTTEKITTVDTDINVTITALLFDTEASVDLVVSNKASSYLAGTLALNETSKEKLNKDGELEVAGVTEALTFEALDQYGDSFNDLALSNATSSRADIAAAAKVGNIVFIKAITAGTTNLRAWVGAEYVQIPVIITEAATVLKAAKEVIGENGTVVATNSGKTLTATLGEGKTNIKVETAFDVLNVFSALVNANVIPSSVTVRDKTFAGLTNATEAIAQASDIQKAIITLAGKNVETDSYSSITLGDLKGKTITAVVNGTTYTFTIAE